MRVYGFEISNFEFFGYSLGLAKKMSYDDFSSETKRIENKKHLLERGENAASNSARAALPLMFYEDLAAEIWKSVALVKVLLKMYDKLWKGKKSSTVLY